MYPYTHNSSQRAELCKYTTVLMQFCWNNKIVATGQSGACNSAEAHELIAILNACPTNFTRSHFAQKAGALEIFEKKGPAF